jgi:small subunit ribosomal protein S20
MANTTSAKKATRKIARRTVINKSRRTQMRGSVRSVEEAIRRGDRDAAIKAMARAEPELMRAAQSNIIRIRLRSSRNRPAEQFSKSPACAGLFVLVAIFSGGDIGFSIRHVVTVALKAEPHCLH